jgi:hypothetical protein
VPKVPASPSAPTRPVASRREPKPRATATSPGAPLPPAPAAGIAAGDGSNRLWIFLGIAAVIAVALLVVGLVRRGDSQSSSSEPALELPDEWVSFTASDGRMSAEFPQPPLEEQQGLAVEGGGAVDVGMYLDENADWSFIVMVSDQGAGSAITLDQLVGGIAQDLGGTVESQKSTELLGADAVDVTIKTGDRTVYATAAVVNDRIVVVEYGAAKAKRNVFERFRDSLIVS